MNKKITLLVLLIGFTIKINAQVIKIDPMEDGVRLENHSARTYDIYINVQNETYNILLPPSHSYEMQFKTWIRSKKAIKHSTIVYEYNYKTLANDIQLSRHRMEEKIEAERRYQRQKAALSSLLDVASKSKYSLINGFGKLGKYLVKGTEFFDASPKERISIIAEEFLPSEKDFIVESAGNSGSPKNRVFREQAASLIYDITTFKYNTEREEVFVKEHYKEVEKLTDFFKLNRDKVTSLGSLKNHNYRLYHNQHIISLFGSYGVDLINNPKDEDDKRKLSTLAEGGLQLNIFRKRVTRDNNLAFSIRGAYVSCNKKFKSTSGEIEKLSNSFISVAPGIAYERRYGGLEYGLMGGVLFHLSPKNNKNLFNTNSYFGKITIGNSIMGTGTRFAVSYYKWGLDKFLVEPDFMNGLFLSLEMSLF